MGKKIKVYQYVPLLDDRNVNDQGLDAAGAVMVDGNLYGSSRDAGKITSRLPQLAENGGRVNRVGFTRLEREGSIANFGMFFEFTEDSFQFDSDSELYGHLSRELVTGATQLTEAVLQNDLLAAAGVIVYAGTATSNATVTAEGAGAAIVDFEDLERLHTILNDNRTPKQTKVITGSRMIDTKTVAGGRVMYIGTELESTIKRITDPLHSTTISVRLTTRIWPPVHEVGADPGNPTLVRYVAKVSGKQKARLSTGYRPASLL